MIRPRLDGRWLTRAAWAIALGVWVKILLDYWLGP